MVATPSTMVRLGTDAPEFTLKDAVSGNLMSLSELKSDKATVIMFICNHCPYVKHINDSLVELSNKYIKKGVAFIAINSNDIENYPEDSPDNMKNNAEKLGFRFPYLFDDKQDVAKAYQAACTPDIYVYDRDIKLAYRGQYDDSRPGNGIPVTGKDIAAALDALLSGAPVSGNQIPSIGCNIKWKRN